MVSATPQAAVDEVDLAGDERGVVGGEERDEVGDVFGGLLPLQVLNVDVVGEGLLGEVGQGGGRGDDAAGGVSTRAYSSPLSFQPVRAYISGLDQWTIVSPASSRVPR